MEQNKDLASSYYLGASESPHSIEEIDFATIIKTINKYDLDTQFRSKDKVRIMCRR